MRKIRRSLTVALSMILIVTLTLLIGSKLFTRQVASAQYVKGVAIASELDLTDVDETRFSPNSEYISYTEFRNTIATPTATPASIIAATKGQGKIIRIDSAQELHRFSVDVSPFEDKNYSTNGTYDKIQALLSLDYVLGNDIDYLEMTGNTFIPIGFHYIKDNNTYHQSFTGTFDGRGFEIKNLYLADYHDLVIIEDEEDIMVIPYYAMFTFNDGVISNLGLVDPHYELRLSHDQLTKAAHLVGENNGTVNHTFVIYKDKEAGIMMRTQTGQTQSSYEAAGLVYKNNGTFTNSYYAGDVVINKVHIKNFKVQPVLYQSTNNHSNLVYDSTIYKSSVDVGGQTIDITPVNSLNTGQDTTTLKTSGLGNTWFYYPNYRYPALFGLTESSNNLQITNGVELVFYNKLLRLNYNDTNNVSYRSRNYVLTNDIDMRMASPSAYKTPSRDFSGKLDGNNNYIGYLTIAQAVTVNEEYYSGMFSVLLGEVSNLVIVKSAVTLTKKEATKMFYHIGLLAGSLNDAKIENVKIDGSVSIGEKNPRELNLGLLAGDGFGEITNTYARGDVNSNTVFDKTDLTQINYYIGGIIGRATNNKTLKMNKVLHVGDIFGPSSTNPTRINSLTVYLGGVVGHSTNSLLKHEFKDIMHAGTINLSDLYTDNLMYYAAGTIGYSGGTGYQVSDNNRNWLHRGTIFSNITAVNTTTRQVLASGVVNANHSEKTEFIGLYNDHLIMDASQQMLVDSQSNRYLVFAPLINSLSTSGIIVSQSKNEGDQVYTYHTENSGIILTKGPSLLRFVENVGNYSLSDFSYNTKLTIAGISKSDNIDYLNVINKGEIKVFNLTNTSNVNMTASSRRYFDSQDDASLRVGGIAVTLSANKFMRNAYSNAKISIANVDINKANLYVGGLVVENQAGDLHTQDNELTPKALFGIINSVNYSNITSTTTNDIYGINGRGNTFVGGIVSLNKGSIQDTINHGNITFYNKYTNPSIVFETDVVFAGRVRTYESGVIVGGIAASIASQYSRVYDTSNGGDIIGVSMRFARSGGIVAQSLSAELKAGLVYEESDTNILNSIISNGINYSSVLAITNQISQYNRSQVNPSGGSHNNLYVGGSNTLRTLTALPYPTTVATSERPGIHSSSGGVIGYGLSEMRRMINHGRIIATDVAGGVVGATFIHDENRTQRTYVKIDTAINYGEVRAFRTTSYNSFDKINFNISNINNYLYGVNDDFIFPTGVSAYDLRMAPRHKRGIGGVFGRLQRGGDEHMVGDGTEGSFFDFVVNMNPNVDLIGRLDQNYNFTYSSIAFKFANAKYYSARQNDSTSAMFTGYYVKTNGVRYPIGQYSDEILYDKIRYFEYNENGRRYRQYQGYGILRTRQSALFAQTQHQGIFLSIGNQRVDEGLGKYLTGGTITYEDNNIIWRDLQSRIDIGEANLNLEDTYFPNPNGKQVSTTSFVGNINYNPQTYSTSGLSFHDLKEVPWITENHTSNPEAINLYDPAFEMRNDKTILSNGESIAKYIYFAPNSILGERFKPTRPQGMYVLASTAGSVFGSTLPINTRINQLAGLDGSKPYNIDYEDPSNLAVIDHMTDHKYLKYKNLFQTYLNDKSELLKDNQTLSFKEKTNGFEVGNSVINHNTKTITFEYNMELLDVGQDHVDFEIPKASLPFRAFLAAPYDSTIHPAENEFRQALFQEKMSNPSQVSSTVYPTILRFTFAGNPNFMTTYYGKYNTTANSYETVLGNVRSYSEAALTEASLFNQFYTDYTVRIIFKAAVAPNIRPVAYIIDSDNIDNQVTIPSTTTYPYTINTPINQYINIRHHDLPGILNVGYDFTHLLELYYVDSSNNDHLVDKQYYTITGEPVNPQGYFRSIINFGDQLKAGTYKISFKYYNSGDTRDIIVTKAAKTTASIEMLKHQYSDILTNPNTNFSTTVPFLYEISNSDMAITTNTNSTEPYLYDKSYSIPFLEELKLTPFAELTNATFTKNFLPTGYVRFIVTYTVKAENGSTYTYNHTLNEVPVELLARYTNGVISHHDPLTANRDDEMTIFGIHYNMHPDFIEQFYNLNPNDPIHLRIDNDQGYDSSNYGTSYGSVDISMDYDVAPGDYTFTINVVRIDNNGASHVINLGSHVLRKLAGTSAYLKNIEFGEEGLEVSYPTIKIINPQTNQGPIEYLPGNQNPQFTNYNNSYEAFVYYVGIDYNEADTNNEKHIRIIGELDNTDMTSYVPRMVEHLPVGATIRRLYYQNGVRQYTDPVPKDATPEQLATLEADFTVYPTDGSEPDENSSEDVIITYVVTSEDGLSEAYYYISVSDATFNITYIFNIYYMVGSETGSIGTKTNINDITRFNNIPILVEVTNMDTELPFTDVHQTVGTFPVFTHVKKFQNQMRMYYQALNQSQVGSYKFRFARNRAGFYQMLVDLPDDYNYTITFNDQHLKDINQVDGDNTDPRLANIEGKYFYINQGIRNRIRRLDIIISHKNYEGGWGLHQNKTTYHD